MAGHKQLAVLATCCLWAACGGGGGGGAGFGGSADASLGIVHLLDHSPAADAVQVPLDAVIQLEFDASMALDSFGDEDTWLRVLGTNTNVAGTWTRVGNQRVDFTPAAPLAAETDYVFQLSALTCDMAGRILDTATEIAFRTFDATPPVVVGIDLIAGAQNQSRTRTFTVTFNEPLAAATVTDTSFYLRDIYGFRYAGTRTRNGNALTLDPFVDLPGDRNFQLVATTALTDKAGNQFANNATTSFRTIVDTVSPSVVTAWPSMNQTGVSPRVQPTFAFDESMDPATVEASSLLFQDEFGSVVAFAIDSNAEQRTLRVRPSSPLVANRRYTMAFLLGGAAATDTSGNALVATQARTFTTGTDDIAPAIVASMPAAADTRVPPTMVATVTFAEALDPSWVDIDTVSLSVNGAAWTIVVERPTTTTVRVTPVLALPTNANCSLGLRGGQEGLHDLAGNVPASDTVIAFTTSADAGTPTGLMLPPDGAVSIAPNSRMSFTFDAAMAIDTLNTSTLRVTDDLGTPLAGQFVISGGNRIVLFTPATPLAQLTYYRLTIVGGSAGVRRTSGNWFPADRTSRFRTGSALDSAPPSVTATVNGIHSSRLANLVLPPSGFTIDVTANDTSNQWADMGTTEVLLSGTGTGPGAPTLLAAATIGYGTLRVQVPSAAALGAGTWTLSVRVRDLAGNVGTSTAVPFTVVQPTSGLLPFDGPQLVWVRTDLDRDGNDVPDFEDDMLRLGFATAGDPLGTNAWMRRLVLDGILAQSSHLYGRGSRGEPLDSGSVGLRFTTRQPIRVAHMQMALGGLDPEANRQRTYGDDSSGVLGRAYYDYRNGNVSERNTASSPGLGVFPAEMWLYQTKIHLQVYPAYQTAFAQKFRPICLAMGGTPAGAHALDNVVLSANFDYSTATTAQRARWQTIMNAADDWALVIGIILAHEVGHSVGLVAPGAAPSGLFGDSSLHDSYAGAAEVMAPSVGYEAMTALDYAFRDIDLAYLRQRVLLQ